MSRSLPDGVRQVADALADEAGGYLRNTIRRPGETCIVCSAPVTPSFERCFWCNEHRRSGEPIADRVASMVYAVESLHELDQMYKTMRGYKATPAIEAHVRIVSSLLALGLRGHAQCDVRLSRAQTYQWATVPSTKNLSVEHPLHHLVTSLDRGRGSEVVVTPRPRVSYGRSFSPESFIASPVMPGGHVAVIDDSWVQGGHAQSVAAAVRRAGAGTVSIMTVARVLDPTFGPNPEFIRRRLIKSDFDPYICPWTGADCP